MIAKTLKMMVLGAVVVAGGSSGSGQPHEGPGNQNVAERRGGAGSGDPGPIKPMRDMLKVAKPKGGGGSGEPPAVIADGGGGSGDPRGLGSKT